MIPNNLLQTVTVSHFFTSNLLHLLSRRVTFRFKTRQEILSFYVECQTFYVFFRVMRRGDIGIKFLFF